MKGTRVEVPGMVISATADSVQVAVTEDNKQSKKADFTINMKTPLKSRPRHRRDGHLRCHVRFLRRQPADDHPH